MHKQSMIPEAPAFRLSEITSLLANLAELMADEVDYLKEMKISEIEKFQADKARMLATLENYRRTIMRTPDILKYASDKEKDQYKKVHELFGKIAHENGLRLGVAKEVNAKMLDIIKQAVSEVSASPIYNDSGRKNSSSESLNMKLNEMI